jgi:hypothetical protein
VFTTDTQKRLGSVHGRVVNGENNLPIANARIEPYRADEVLSQMTVVSGSKTYEPATTMRRFPLKVCGSSN